MSKSYNREEMIETIKHYDSYYKKQRTKRGLYILSTAINGFVNWNDLENPNQYLLYLVAVQNLALVKNQKDYLMITDLQNHMENDIHLFQTIKLPF